jgi:copper chaperone NosL
MRAHIVPIGTRRIGGLLPPPPISPEFGQGTLAVLAGIAAVLLLASGCEGKRPVSEAFPQDIRVETACYVDGMLLMSHPGPKGQMELKDGSALFFCDTKELFQALHDPNMSHRIARAYAQPMDGREWGAYPNGWEEVGRLTYVLGSRRTGSMGPTIVPFRGEQAARDFAAAEGGWILAGSDLTAQIVADYLRDVQEQLRREGSAGGGTETGAHGDGHGR